MPTRKEKHEIEVFSAFAKAVAFPIVHGTVRSGVSEPEPGEPDVVCRLLGGECAGFELTRSADHQRQARTERIISLHSELWRLFELMPESQRVSFADISFGVSFRSEGRAFAKLKSCSQVLELVRKTRPKLGDLTVPPELKVHVDRVNVSQATGMKFLAHVEGGGFFRDPVVERVIAKVRKTYACISRLDLLVYYDLQDSKTYEIWAEENRAEICHALVGSDFETVWVWDQRNQRLLDQIDKP